MDRMNPLENNPKLMTMAQAEARRAELKRAGRRLVLTNGCFDLLHCGHLYYLRAAAELGDELWVGLNGEASVRALKGPTRPVQGDLERAYSLGALPFVHGLFLFHTPRLDAEIRALAPDVYAKAGDYTEETLDPGERAALRDVGAQIRFLPFLPGYSSTKLIAKIAEAARAGTL